MTTQETAQPTKSWCPWWLSILTAIIVYSCLKYLIPNVFSENPEMQQLSQLAPQLAPVLTIPFLLLGAKQLYDGVTPKKEEELEKEQQEEL